MRTCNLIRAPGRLHALSFPIPMQSWNKIPRIILFITLLTGLLAGLSAPVFVDESASAAPMGQIATNVVISEFRTTGPNGGTDEFVEIYNPTNTSINISGWKIKKSSGCGVTITSLTFPAAITSIASGQYLLITGAGYSGLTTSDFPSTLGIADDGGIAITNAIDAVIDQVGMCSSTLYQEGATLAPLSGTANQSYERGNIGCTDTDNNAADFIWNQTSSNPQNSSSIPIPCLRVTNVTSTANGTYLAGASLAVTITFSTNVNVTGSPTLLLETGATDRNATYSSGSGSNVLTFNYTVMAGDVSGDLDYVAANSLSLNGGTITGAVGNANLTLPSPGTANSLGANSAIIIDNQAPPSTISFTRQTPSSSPTNVDTLIFRAAFNEPVANVEITDFVVHSNTIPAPTTTATVTNVTTISSSIYDVTISGGDLLSSTFNGIVGLDLSGAQNITDTAPALNLLPNSEPTIDELYTVDNFSPTVTVEQATGQADPANATPINFTVVFSEAISVSTFTAGDITQNGTIAASLITWGITPTINPLIFTLSATAVAGIGTTGTLIPTISLDKVFDVAGNGNTLSTSSDNSVTFNDTIAPTVTINQAIGQTDPTALFPINFTVVFSEPIIASIFTPADITQNVNGTATGITWSITDSGDHTTFTVSATAATGTGTVIPFIAANRVTDLVGNNNIASGPNTDDTVVYETTRPTVTVNQAVGQADPTALFPINFTVVFSELINVSTFTTADITQNGTATGITWAITPTINPLIFTLSATALTGKGTLIPTIAVNKVTDVAGNNNFASTSTDNTVTSTANLATPTRTLTPTATATPTLGVVIISEVAWMGTLASSTDEWVELYNSGSTVVDLSNWTLSSTDGVISISFLATDSDHMINPGEYFILAQSGTFTDVTINKNISATFDNNGKSLQLRNNLGILMDTANSDGGTWPAGIASPTFATMERHAGTTLDSAVNWYTFAGTPTKHDRTNNLVKGTPGYANWAAFVTATPSRTPTATSRPPTPFRTSTPVFQPVGRPVINEFLPRPGFDWNQDGKVDVFDEFIEIKNLGVVDISMSGWKLDDDENKGSAPFSLPNVILKPGERLVFYGLQTNILLSDGGDTVRLLNPSNQVYDAYTYKIAKTEDASICRLPDTNLFGAWYEDCVPTPNLINTRDGIVPSMPENGFESPVCDLPDTLPADFLFAECRGYGAKIWNSYYWDKVGWQGDQFVPENRSKWESFVE